jgi:hypothetical protein
VKFELDALDSASEPGSIEHLALPNLDTDEPEFLQSCNLPRIAPSVGVEFLEPEAPITFRYCGAGAATVMVPKAPMDEYSPPASFVRDVWAARQAGALAAVF